VKGLEETKESVSELDRVRGLRLGGLVDTKEGVVYNDASAGGF
jgi:hypothetical protein